MNFLRKRTGRLAALAAAGCMLATGCASTRIDQSHDRLVLESAGAVEESITRKRYQLHIADIEQFFEFQGVERRLIDMERPAISTHQVIEDSEGALIAHKIRVELRPDWNFNLPIETIAQRMFDRDEPRILGSRDGYKLMHFAADGQQPDILALGARFGFDRVEMLLAGTPGVAAQLLRGMQQPDRLMRNWSFPASAFDGYDHTDWDDESLGILTWPDRSEPEIILPED